MALQISGEKISTYKEGLTGEGVLVVVNNAIKIENKEITNQKLYESVVSILNFEGEDILSSSLVSSKTGDLVESYNEETGVLTLTSESGVSIAQMTTALKSVKYSSYNQNPKEEVKNISFLVSSEDETIELETKVNIIAVNDAPVFNVESIDLATFADEGVSYTITYADLMGEANVMDYEGDTITFVVSKLNTKAGTLVFQESGDVVKVNSEITADDVLVWTPSNVVTSATDGSLISPFSVKVKDAGAISKDARDVKIAVNDVNIAPEIKGSAKDVVYTENAKPVSVATSFTVLDSDAGKDATLVEATVKIAVGESYLAEDTLSFIDTAKLTHSFDNATGVLTISLKDGVTGVTASEMSAALKAVKYENSSEDPSVSDRTVTYTVRDGGTENSVSNTVTSIVKVAPVNDAPVFFEIIEQNSLLNHVLEINMSNYIDIVDSDDVLQYSAEGLPKGLSIDKYTGIISGQPELIGNYTVKVMAVDLGGLKDTVSFKINVENYLEEYSGEISILSAEIIPELSDIDSFSIGTYISGDAKIKFTTPTKGTVEVDGETYEITLSEGTATILIDDISYDYKVLSQNSNSIVLGQVNADLVTEMNIDYSDKPPFFLPLTKSISALSLPKEGVLSLYNTSTESFGDYGEFVSLAIDFANNNIIFIDINGYQKIESFSVSSNVITLKEEYEYGSETTQLKIVSEHKDYYIIHETRTSKFSHAGESFSETMSETFAMSKTPIFDYEYELGGDYNFVPYYEGEGTEILGYEDTPLVITKEKLLEGFVDLDGDYLTVTDVSVSGGTITPTGYGDKWTFTPDEDFYGEITISYKVSDGESVVEHTGVLNIADVYDAPTSTDADFVVEEDGKLNASLPEALDIEGTGAVYVKGTDPEHGTVVVNEDGTFEYIPDADFNGTDSFTFTVTSGLTEVSNKLDYVFVIDDTGSMSGTITSVRNNVTEFVNSLVNHGIDARFSFIRYGEHSEGEATFSGFFDATTLDGFKTSLNTVYAHGGADGEESGLEALMLLQDESQVAFRADAIKRAVVLTDINFKDLDSGLYYSSGPALYAMNEVVSELVKDGIIVDIAGSTYSEYITQYSQVTGPTGGTISNVYDPTFYEEGFGVFTNYYTATIDVTPVNDVPEATDATVEVEAGTYMVLDMLGEDIDGDTLSYTVVDAPSHGTISKNELGQLIYTADSGYSGADSFTYKVNDGKVDSDNIATVSIGVSESIYTGDLSIETTSIYGSNKHLSGTAKENSIIEIVFGGATYEFMLGYYNDWSVNLEYFTPISGELNLIDGTNNSIVITNKDFLGNVLETISSTIYYTSVENYAPNLMLPWDESLSMSAIYFAKDEEITINLKDRVWDSERDDVTINIAGDLPTGLTFVDGIISGSTNERATVTVILNDGKITVNKEVLINPIDKNTEHVYQRFDVETGPSISFDLNSLTSGGKIFESFILEKGGYLGTNNFSATTAQFEDYEFNGTSFDLDESDTFTHSIISATTLVANAPEGTYNVSLSNAREVTSINGVATTSLYAVDAQIEVLSVKTDLSTTTDWWNSGYSEWLEDYNSDEVVDLKDLIHQFNGGYNWIYISDDLKVAFDESSMAEDELSGNVVKIEQTNDDLYYKDDSYFYEGTTYYSDKYSHGESPSYEKEVVGTWSVENISGINYLVIDTPEAKRAFKFEDGNVYETELEVVGTTFTETWYYGQTFEQISEFMTDIYSKSLAYIEQDYNYNPDLGIETVSLELYGDVTLDFRDDLEYTYDRFNDIHGFDGDGKDEIILEMSDFLNLALENELSVSMDSLDVLSVDGDSNLVDGITGWESSATVDGLTTYTKTLDTDVLTLNVYVDTEIKA